MIFVGNEPQISFFLIAVAVFFAFAFAFLIIPLFLRQQKKKLLPLAQQIGGEVIASLFKGVYLLFPYQEAEARVVLRTGGQNSPPRTILELNRSAGFHLSITKENPLTRALERLGLSEIKVGDPEFDRKYYLYTKDKTQAINLLSDPKKRALIDQLFKAGFEQVQMDEQKIWCSKIGHTLEADFIRQNFEKLYKLSQM